MTDTVVDLIKDLTSKLGAMADEFGHRAARVDRGDAAAPGEADLTAAAQRLIAQRKLRARHFSTDLFHEPAWDMLLALFIVRDDPRPMFVKSLVACADAPVTTSQRWIEHLDKLGLVHRRTDANDRRRIEISLTVAGRDALTGYLRAIAG